MNYSQTEKFDLFLDFLELPGTRRRALLERYSVPELQERFRSGKDLEGLLGDRAGNFARVREEFPDRLARLDAAGIRALTGNSEGYPKSLAPLADRPFVLYCIGDISLLNTRCLSVVGRRACRAKWLDLTERFAETFARNGLTVVSGLAEGCDAAAHRGALKADGKTVAVLAGGLDCVYPQSNIELFREIAEKGLVVSEHAPGFRPMRHDFLLRNRIVAGLSEGTLVTCAAERSGTLATASDALEYGRELFVLPGDVESEDSRGTNRLIRDAQGALVTCPEDVLHALGIVPETGGAPPEKELTPAQKSLLDVLTGEELHINEIAVRLNTEAFRLLPLLSVMEIQGLVERMPSNVYRIKR